MGKKTARGGDTNAIKKRKRIFSKDEKHHLLGGEAVGTMEVMSRGRGENWWMEWTYRESGVGRFYSEGCVQVP